MTRLPSEEARIRAGTLGVSVLRTYVGHGHVFANAMTGNVVLLGINCFTGSWRTGIRHLPAILAFVVGVSTAQAIQLRSKRRPGNSPYPAVLLLEISVLFLLSLLPAAVADIVFTTSIAYKCKRFAK